MLENRISKQSGLLTEVESKELLKRWGIPVIETKLAGNKKEAVSISKKMGFPVVLKISSSDIVHKSDAGGVKLALSNAAQVDRAYTEITSSARKKYPQAQVQGVSVQKMAPEGIEVIVGMSKDSQFGPVLMFGLGGILVEVLKDVSFRVVPVTESDAAEMIKEIKGYPVLQGYRGKKLVSIPALEKIIVEISQFVEQNSRIKELDLNPVFAYEDGAVVVDARIVVEG